VEKGSVGEEKHLILKRQTSTSGHFVTASFCASVRAGGIDGLQSLSALSGKAHAGREKKNVKFKFCTKKLIDTTRHKKQKGSKMHKTNKKTHVEIENYYWINWSNNE